MIITKQIEIDMGHRVMNHKSKCKNIHGHRYKIEVGVDDKIITEKGVSNEGMVIDFGDLKKIMMNEIDEVYDHGFIMSKEDDLLMKIFDVEIMGEVKNANRYVSLNNIDSKIIVVDFIPTAENLAKHWFDIIKGELEKIKIKLKFVRVWETPTSSAIYEENEKC